VPLIGNKKALLKSALIILTLLYPVAIYYGLQIIKPSYLVILLLIMAALRALCLEQSPLNHWFWLPLLSGLALWTLVSNSPLSLKLYPVLVNLSFLLLFIWSLWNPPTIIERFARLSDDHFPDHAVAYTRTVTLVWCCFFMVNGTISLGLSLFSSDAAWVLYNGLISYLLMGLLFLAEWIIRGFIIRKKND
jgi:uncharacterized membrane protein